MQGKIKYLMSNQCSLIERSPTLLLIPEMLDWDLPLTDSIRAGLLQPLSARRRHRPPNMSDTTSTDGTGAQEEHSGTLSAIEDGEGHPSDQQSYVIMHRSKVMPEEMRTEVLGQLSVYDLNDELVAYINRLFAERYKQWKSHLHHHFQSFDDPQVTLQEGCPKELEGREDSWAWLCGHFQESDYVKAAKANKGNRNKKTFLHHSGPRRFSYRMEAQRRGGGSKFPEIDVFGNVYVRAGNELAESLHATMVERSQMVLHESASQLPPKTPLESVDPPQDAGFQILTETLYQTLGRRPGTYCRGMGNARRRELVGPSSSQSNQVIDLTAEVAELKTQLASYSTQLEQMSQVLASIVRSGVPPPTVGPLSTFNSI
ncbi:unnamed protein product [Prunus brigantina]